MTDIPQQPQVSQAAQEPRKVVVSDVLLVAATPVAAYALAYAYETGYAVRLGVPVSLVRVQTENIAWALVILSLFLIPLVMLLNALTPFCRRPRGPQLGLLMSLAPLVIGIAVGLFLYGTSDLMWIAPAAGWALAELAVLLPAALSRKKGTTFGSRYLANAMALPRGYDLLATARRRAGTTWGLVVPVVLGVSLWISFGLGRLRATVQPERILVGGLPSPTAVIRTYGATWVVGELDTVTWELTGNFMVLDQSSLAGHTLTVSYGRPIRPFRTR